MTLFHWSSRYAVYVPEIDAEHRAIFLMGAELERAVAARAPQARIREIVRALTDHAGDHFAHEERLMRAARYEAFEWHKKQHDGARRRLQQFAERIEADDREAPAELVEYVAHWLHDHIPVTDRMMSAGLRSFEHQQAVAS
jgi:hemerythrin-like metal-binding protein